MNWFCIWKLHLRLKRKYRNDQIQLINNASTTDHGVDISGVGTLGVHSSSLNILLIIRTNGDEDQSWRLVQTIILASAIPVFPSWVVAVTYIQEVVVHATDGAVKYVHLQNQIQGCKWTFKRFLWKFWIAKEAYSCMEAMLGEEGDEGHDRCSRVWRVSNEYLFCLKKPQTNQKRYQKSESINVLSSVVLQVTTKLPVFVFSIH